MKSFLDRFRRKDGEEAPALPVDAPKVDAEVPMRQALPASTPPPKANSAPAPETNNVGGDDDVLMLELGDFLHRIPSSLLKEGPHDLQIPIRFDLDGVAARVDRGEKSVPLKDLLTQAPQIFRDDAEVAPDQEIRFPWQKVLKLLNESAAARSQGLNTETLADQLKKRQVIRNTGAAPGPTPAPDSAPKAGGALRAAGSRQVSWFTRAATTNAAAAPDSAAPTSAPDLVVADPTAGGAPALEQVVDEARQRVESLRKGLQEQAAQKVVGFSADLEWQLQTLQQENAALEQQLHAARSPAPDTDSASATREPMRSQKEYQRTIDELNRRILALETNQKDRTQEISKEKEIRLRAERQLAAAERSLEESASRMEALREEGRRELENALRLRDEESDRLRAEQIQNAERAKQEGDRIASERDEIAARLRGAEPQASTSAQPEAWESRAAAQLEQDIESYRTRIKTLLQERDAAIKEREFIAAELASRVQSGDSAAPAAAATGDLAALQAQVTKLSESNAALEREKEESAHRLQEQLAAADQEKETLSRRVEELKSGEAAAGPENLKGDYSTVALRLRLDHDRAVQERDQAQLATEKLLSEMNTLREEHRHEREKFDRERNASQQSAERGTAGLRKAIDTQQKAIASLTKERDDLQNGRDTVTAELNQARAEARRLSAEVLKVRDELLTEHDKLAGELNETRSSQEETLAALVKERDELRARHEASAKEIERLEKERSEVPAKIAMLRRDWHEEREALSTQINAAYRARDEFRSEHDDMATQMAAIQTKHEAAVQELEMQRRNWHEERDHLQAQLASEAETLAKRSRETEEHLQLLDGQLQQAREEKEHLVAEKQRELQGLRQDHARELETLEASQKQTLQGALSTNEAAIAERDETISELQDQNRTLASEQERITAAHQSELAALRTEQQKVAEALEHSHRETHASVSEREQAITALQEQLSHLTAEHQKLAADHEHLTASKEREVKALHQEHQATLEKLEQGGVTTLAKRDHTIEELRELLEKATAEQSKVVQEKSAELEALQKRHQETECALQAARADLETREEAITTIRAEQVQLQAGHDTALNALRSQLEEAVTSRKQTIVELQSVPVQVTRQNEQDLAETRAAHEAALESLRQEQQAALASIEARQQAALADAYESAEQKQTEIAELQRQLKEQAAGQENALAEVRAAQTKEIAEMAKQHKAALASKEKTNVGELPTRQNGTERRLNEQIAQLTQERDSARAEVVALNQRLSTQAQEASKAQAALVAERDLVVSEREALETALIMQRDEATTRLETERAAHQQEVRALQAQVSELSAEESEVRNRLEQENGRLRRERDATSRERDELRERIERLFEHQREFLSGMAGVSGPPSRRENIRNYPIPAPEPIGVNPKVYVMPRQKPAEKVDFVEAEIVKEPTPEIPKFAGNVNLPRIRPMPVRPPQVRKLG